MHIYRPGFRAIYIVDSKHIEDPRDMPDEEGSRLLRALPSVILPLVLGRRIYISRAALHKH
jgi:hypothetical protein